MVLKKYRQFFVIIFTSVMLSGCLETVFVGTTGTVMELAKDRPAGDAITDVRISTAIKAEFVKRNFRDLYAKIKIEVVQGRVLLTGTIDNDQDAVTAVEISWNQQGVSEVINELRVDKNSNKFDLVQYTRDTMITSQIKSKTFMDREIKFVNYTVITINDEVYLFGIARSESELEKVADIASNVHGVKKVISHVKLQSGDVVSKSDNKDYVNSADNLGTDKEAASSKGNNLVIDQDANDLSLDEGIGDNW
jgi:osmotically-inducible protein OsmY